MNPNDEKSITSQPLMSAPLHSEALNQAQRLERNIKSQLALRGISQKDIALNHGLHPSDVSRVIKGDRRCSKVRRCIAIELGVTYETLWGTSEV